MACVPEIEKRRKDKKDALEALDDLVRYYRTNAHRMKFRLSPGPLETPWPSHHARLDLIVGSIDDHYDDSHRPRDQFGVDPH